MTSRQLRDIAAYFGAPCNYDFEVETHQDRELYQDTVCGPVLSYLEKGRLKNFKLRLRPLETLTDEEVFTIADIAIAKGGRVDRLMCEIRRVNEKYYDPIIFGDYHLRSDGSSYHHDYWISSDGIFGDGDGSDGNEMRTYEEAAVFAYLQSIGVYVPNTIDEELVELIEI